MEQNNRFRFGAFYTYNEATRAFVFQSGKPHSFNGRENSVPYSATVSLVEGTHPELFSANGSHGVWGDAGKFEYSNQPSLIDFTSRGVGWRLWFNLVYIDARAAGTFSGTDLQWADFQGRWGNDDRLVSIGEISPLPSQRDVKKAVHRLRELP